MTLNHSSQIILVGGFSEIIELCELCGRKILGIIDNKLCGKYMGYEVLGDDRCAMDLYSEYEEVPLILTPDEPKIRRHLASYYSRIGFKFCNLISPDASISKYAKIGTGVTIQGGVNISSMVSVEDFVKINSLANIMHEVKIEAYSTIAPNAVVLGRVKISESCYVGSNATILPEVVVGRCAVVGAGAVVIKDVRDGVKVIGNPAREMANIACKRSNGILQQD